MTADLCALRVASGVLMVRMSWMRTCPVIVPSATSCPLLRKAMLVSGAELRCVMTGLGRKGGFNTNLILEHITTDLEREEGCDTIHKYLDNRPLGGTKDI